MSDLRDFIESARNGEHVHLDTTWHESKWDERSRPAWRRNRNQSTQANAKRKWAAWTEEEHRLAMDPNLTATQVAEMTGRTWESVIRKRSRLRNAGKQHQ